MNFAWMKCRATASSGWPSFSYMARKNSGRQRQIIPMTARLVLPERFIRKNAGTPVSAAAPKQTSCRFVSPKNTLVFTRVRSRGMEIYAAMMTSFPGQWAFSTLRARPPVLNRVNTSRTVYPTTPQREPTISEVNEMDCISTA